MSRLKWKEGSRVSQIMQEVKYNQKALRKHLKRLMKEYRWYTEGIYVATAKDPMFRSCGCGDEFAEDWNRKARVVRCRAILVAELCDVKLAAQLKEEAGVDASNVYEKSIGF